MDDLTAPGDVVENARPSIDDGLRVEVAIARSVDRAVDSYEAKRRGWKQFTNFDSLVPASARRAA